MNGPGRSRRRFLAAVGAAAVGAGCATAPDAASDGPTTAERTSGSPTAGQSTGGQGGTAGASESGQFAEGSVYTRVYRETIDSVVLIQVLDGTNSGQGSGWVYDESHVVTNEHVVSGADEVEVQFSSGDWRVGTVVGTDVYSDLAAVRVPSMPAGATPLALLDGDPPVGTRVVALGNPFGLEGSISAGIVSGVNRTLEGRTAFSIPDTIQTDAAVNPGNSGGPLVTLDGRVVGVIDAGGGENIAFAISAALVARVVPALVETGEYRHAYMGVTLSGVTPSIARANDLREARGVIIDDVLPGGPSDGVLQGSDDTTVVDGLRVPVGGDVVVAMDDRPIPGDQALSTFLALETSPGDTIDVEVIRDGERETVQLTLGERPPPDGAP